MRARPHCWEMEQPSDQKRCSWFIHYIVNRFPECQQLVFEVIILTLRVSLNFFSPLIWLIGNDFYNSARRSSLSLLLVKPCLINLWGKDRKKHGKLCESLGHFSQFAFDGICLSDYMHQLNSYSKNLLWINMLCMHINCCDYDTVCRVYRNKFVYLWVNDEMQPKLCNG